MERSFLMGYFEKGLKIKLYLKNKQIYTGTIIQLEGSSMLFLDKYGTKIPIDLNSISHILPAEQGEGSMCNGGKNDK